MKENSWSKVLSKVYLFRIFKKIFFSQKLTKNTTSSKNPTNSLSSCVTWSRWMQFLRKPGSLIKFFFSTHTYISKNPPALKLILNPKGVHDYKTIDDETERAITPLMSPQAIPAFGQPIFFSNQPLTGKGKDFCWA